jgi:hypothetical protein
LDQTRATQPIGFLFGIAPETGLRRSEHSEVLTRVHCNGLQPGAEEFEADWVRVEELPDRSNERSRSPSSRRTCQQQAPAQTSSLPESELDALVELRTMRRGVAAEEDLRRPR